MAEDFTDAAESMIESMSLDGDPNKLAAYYDKWASEYDADVSSHGYGLPTMMVSLLRQVTQLDLDYPQLLSPDCAVLDVGCGTGLVGVELAAAGYTNLTGIDLSDEMIKVARSRNIYTNLIAGVDITQPAPAALRSSADVVTIAGVFTVGHVPPEALAVVSTMVRPGGIVLASTRAAYFQNTNYQAFSDSMLEDGNLELLLRIDDAPYTMDSTAHYWAYRVPSHKRSS